MLLRAGVLAVLLAGAAEVRANDLDPAVVQLWDVIYMADGSVLRGVIVEEVPGTSYRIVMAGGSSLVVQTANVTKLGKELNPGFAMAARPAGGVAGGTGAPPHARKATSGVRLGLMPGFAEHPDADVSTFLVTARAGYEIGLDPWGLTPALVVDVMPGTYDDWAGVAIMASLRAAYRASTISPFVNFGLGVDTLRGDTSLGTFLGGGLELLVHKNVAITAELRYHQGWADSSNVYTLQYVGGGMGVEVRL
jgi:hypothetical protein